jgi:hypothetical protein
MADGGYMPFHPSTKKGVLSYLWQWIVACWAKDRKVWRDHIYSALEPKDVRHQARTIFVSGILQDVFPFDLRRRPGKKVLEVRTLVGTDV